MGAMPLPPGFRFHPTDEELVGYYLKRKVDGSVIELEVIPVIDLYKFDPWELPDKSFLPKKDMKWFFFCPRGKKNPNGSRTNRATGSGYWKATGKDRKIDCQSVTAVRKTLVFYHGRAPAGDRTDWVMHEYRLCEEISQGITNYVGAFALCHVIKRNELGHRAGEPQGESRGRRGSSSSTDNNPSPRRCMRESANAPEDSSPNPSNAFCRNYGSFPTSPAESGKGTQIDPIVVDQDETIPGEAESLISESSKQAFPLEGNEGSAMIPQDEFRVSPLQFPFYTPMDLSLTTPSVELNEEAGYMMPCLSPTDCMGLWINESSFPFQGIQWEEPRNLNQPMNGAETWSFMFSPLICRQATGDGIGESANPWFPDDFVR